MLDFFLVSKWKEVKLLEKKSLKGIIGGTTLSDEYPIEINKDGRTYFILKGKDGKDYFVL